MPDYKIIMNQLFTRHESLKLFVCATIAVRFRGSDTECIEKGQAVNSRKK
jgi:hypothetical protein